MKPRLSKLNWNEKKLRLDRMVCDILGKDFPENPSSSKTNVYSSSRSSFSLSQQVYDTKRLVSSAIRRRVFVNLQAKKVVINYLLHKPNISKDLRKQIWLTLADVYGNIKIYQGLYDELSFLMNNTLQTVKKLIVMDVRRTSPSLTDFQRDSLVQILFNFAKRNLRTSYCQGMNFIAEFLHVQIGFSEEETFWLLNYLVEVIGESNYSNMVNLLADMKIVSQLVEHSIETSIETLKRSEFDLKMITLPWFITLFSKMKSNELRIVIFDQIISNGQIASIRIATVILSFLIKRFKKFDNLNNLHLQHEEFLESNLQASYLRNKILQFYLDLELLNKLRTRFAREEWKRARKNALIDPYDADKCSIKVPFCTSAVFDSLKDSYEDFDSPVVFRCKDILLNMDPDYYLQKNINACYSSLTTSQVLKEEKRTSITIRTHNSGFEQEDLNKIKLDDTYSFTQNSEVVNDMMSSQISFDPRDSLCYSKEESLEKINQSSYEISKIEPQQKAVRNNDNSNFDRIVIARSEHICYHRFQEEAIFKDPYRYHKLLGLINPNNYESELFAFHKNLENDVLRLKGKLTSKNLCTILPNGEETQSNDEPILSRANTLSEDKLSPMISEIFTDSFYSWRIDANELKKKLKECL